jgi:hypothetical protein
MMPFTMPRNWQKMSGPDTGDPSPRTVFYDGDLYVSVNDLRRTINRRQKKMTNSSYLAAMIWMRNLLKGLLGEEDQ